MHLVRLPLAVDGRVLAFRDQEASRRRGQGFLEAALEEDYAITPVPRTDTNALNRLGNHDATFLNIAPCLDFFHKLTQYGCPIRPEVHIEELYQVNVSRKPINPRAMEENGGLLKDTRD